MHVNDLRRRLLRPATAAAIVTALAACGENAEPPASDESAAPAAEPSVHERLLVLDTHLDTPWRIEYPDFDVRERHDPVSDYSQVDLPRMVEGGLDGGFWVIYTEQGELTPAAYAAARDSALFRAIAIRDMVNRNPEQLALATTADEAAAIVASGRRLVYQSIENSYPLGEDLSLLQTFYDFGVRMIGPVHSSNNQFADSSTDEDGLRWQGLSPLGRELVAEANRLGMILDGSHAHDLALDQMLELSATPLVLSHSGPKAVFDHPRNVDDERLLKLAESGGVIHMNALGAYLTELERPEDRWPKTKEIAQRYPLPRRMTEAEAGQFFAERRELDRQFELNYATFDDYMEHVLYVLELVGPEHVGIGADWDGGGGVAGMMDVSYLPKITERLLAEGYSESDLEKIWSGNLLRLLRQAEAHAESLTR